CKGSRVDVHESTCRRAVNKGPQEVGFTGRPSANAYHELKDDFTRRRVDRRHQFLLAALKLECNATRRVVNDHPNQNVAIFRMSHLYAPVRLTDLSLSRERPPLARLLDRGRA